MQGMAMPDGAKASFIRAMRHTIIWRVYAGVPLFGEGMQTKCNADPVAT